MNVSILSNINSDCDDNEVVDDKYNTNNKDNNNNNNKNSNNSSMSNDIAVNTNFISILTKIGKDNKSKGIYSNCLQKDYPSNDNNDDDENDTSSTTSIHSSIEDDNDVDDRSDSSENRDDDSDDNEEDGIPKSIVQELYTLLVLAIPSMISQLSWCIPNSIVASYVGIQYGTIYLTSYSIVTSIVSLCTLSLLEGIFDCMDTLMCQSYGYKKYNSLQLLSIRGIIVCFIIIIPFIILLICTMKYIIINILHQDDTIASIVYEYFLIYCICLPFYIVYNTIVIYLGAQNIVLPEAYTVLVSVCIVLPLSLQYCTIIFDFYGTAVALVITQIFQTLFLLCYVYYTKCYNPNTWNNIVCTTGSTSCSTGTPISSTTKTNKCDNSNTTIDENKVLQTTKKSKSTNKNKNKNKTQLNTSTSSTTGNSNHSILIKAIFNTKSMSGFIWLSFGGVLATSEWIYWEIICLLISNISGSSSSSASQLSTTTMNTTTLSLLSYDNTYDNIIDTNFTSSSISTSSSIALSIHTIPTQIITVTYMIYIGFGIAISLRIGNVLPINPCNAKRICYISCIFCICLFSIISLLTYVYQDVLIQLFTNDIKIINGCKEIWCNVCIYSFTNGIYALNSSIATGLGQQWTFGIYTIIILFGIGIPFFYYYTVAVVTGSSTGGNDAYSHQNDIAVVVTAWNCIVPPNMLLNVVMGIKLLLSSQSDWEQIAENVRIREDNEEKELQELIN